MLHAAATKSRVELAGPRSVLSGLSHRSFRSLLGHGIALPGRNLALLFQFRGRGVVAGTGARTESRTVEPLRRKAASARGRIALRLCLPRGKGGVGLGSRSHGPAPDRFGKRGRIPGAKSLVNVLVRSETATSASATGPSRGSVSILSARDSDPIKYSAN